MRKKKSFRFLKTLPLLLLVALIGAYQFSGLKGQISPQPPTVFSPVGEALEIDMDRWWSGPAPTISVRWSRTMMNSRYYLIQISNLESGELFREISVSFSSLPDKSNPSYELPITGLIPYTRYALSVSAPGGSVPPTPSRPSIFWIGVKNMPPYESLKPSVTAPTGTVSAANAVAEWLAFDPRTTQYSIELSQPSSLDTYTVATWSLSNPNAPSFSFTQKKVLEQGVQYRFRVKGKSLKNEESSWSEYGTFTVNDDDFSNAVPALLTPSGAQYDFNNTFAWLAVDGAKYYRAEVRGTNNQVSFSRTVLTQNLLDKSKPSVVIPNFPLSDTNTYVWYVTAFSMNETRSKTSELKPFSVPLDSYANKKPVALGPTGIVDKNSAKFSWQKLPRAVGYNISIFVGSKSYLKRVNVSEVGEMDVYAMTFADVPMEYDTEYKFTVQAFDSRYVYSKFSDPVTFRTSSNDFLHVIPEVVGPKGSVESFDCTIFWKKVAGANQYRVNFFTESGFSKPFTYAKYLLASSFPDGDTLSLKIPDCPTDSGITYWYQIQARNAEGWHSKPSEDTRFTIALSEFAKSTPEAIAPSGNVVVRPGVPIELTWKKVATAVSYFVKIYRGDGFQKVVEVLASSVTDPERPSVEFDKSLVIPNGTYAFSVQAKNDNGILSKVSIPLNFSTSSPVSSSSSSSSTSSSASPAPSSAEFAKMKPRVTGPLTGAPETSAITWDPVPGAISYVLWINDHSLGKNTTVLNTSFPLSAVGNPRSPSIATDSLFKNEGIYSLWIQAEMQDATTGKKVSSQWSPRFAFIAGVGTHGENAGGKLASMKPVIKVTPSPAPRMPTISWDPLPGVGAYHLYVKNSSANVVEKVVALNTQELSYQFGYPLQAGKKYTAWVQGVGGGDFSAWSPPMQFTVGN